MPWRRRFVLPWADLFRAAAERGVSPAAFWQLSVKEWLWLIEPHSRVFDGADLESLMEAHPDG